MVGQRQQYAPDLLALLLLERDDVVVDLDGGDRFDEEAGAARGAAVDDAGNGAAMLGAHDEHVAAVAIGDDLLLEVFGGVAAAHEPLQRGPQLRALAPKPLADAGQRRARIVRDVARRIDLLPDVRNLSLERGNPFHQLTEDGKHCRRGADGIT